jgi:hypothetical protein
MTTGVKLFLSCVSVVLTILVWYARGAREQESKWFRLGKRDPFFFLVSERHRGALLIVRIAITIALFVFNIAIWTVA